MRTYHGTFWELPDNLSFGEDIDEYCFTVLDSGYNTDNVLYVSNAEQVAERFCGYNMHGNSDRMVKVVLAGELELSKPWTYDGNPWIDIDDQELHLVNNRGELYEALERQGYDALIIPNNYPEGDDIAFFDGDAFRVDKIKLQRPDGQWTPFLEVDKAIELAGKLKAVEVAKQPAPCMSA